MAKTLSRWAVIGMLAGWSGALGAAPIVTPDGVTGLEVGGVIYDVAIGDMGGKTPGEVYADYSLGVAADPVLTAINSALTSLFATDPGPTLPSYFNGCEDQNTCLVFLPTAFSSGSYRAIDTPQFQSGSIITNVTSVSPLDTIIVDLDFLTYGQVTMAEVPSPDTFALIGLALAWLGLSRRSKA